MGGTRARTTQKQTRRQWSIEERTFSHLTFCFAPAPEETDGEASNPGPRQRRRGPRSADAKERRPERSSAQVFADETLSILHVNIRGFTTHEAELTAMIRNLEFFPPLLH